MGTVSLPSPQKHHRFLPEGPRDAGVRTYQNSESFYCQVHFTAKFNVISVHFAQAMDKYEGMALKLRDYELKKYGQWKAETESRLPLLMKRPLLAVIPSEDHTHRDLVCITHCLNACWCYIIQFMLHLS